MEIARLLNTVSPFLQFVPTLRHCVAKFLEKKQLIFVLAAFQKIYFILFLVPGRYISVIVPGDGRNPFSGFSALKKNLLTYKGYLVENFKPQTVNLRLQGINKYLEFTKQEKLKVKFVKVQQKNFLENVISDADYKFLKTRLKADGYNEWYFIVWFMAATGARAVSADAYPLLQDIQGTES